LAELGAAGKVVAHLHCDRVGTSIDVRGCEAEHANAGADETVLAAVVIDKPISMIAAVVLNGQALPGIEEVRTAYEPTLIVMNRHLDLRSGKSREH
jgi:hypothetical protein